VSNSTWATEVVSHLLVSGPTNGLVSNWMKAFDANIIPTSTFSWMSSLCFAMYLYSESGSPKVQIQSFIFQLNFLLGRVTRAIR
jgi:hypothetical protein